MCVIEGAGFVQGIQVALVERISWRMLGQVREEEEAMEDMLVLPEWAAWRCSRASTLNERGTKGLSPQRMGSSMMRRL